MNDARMARTTTSCAVSAAVVGNNSDGVATSRATNIARANALVTCEITVRSLQTGRPRYDAAPLFQLDPAHCGGLPHSCPIFAFFHFAAQVMVNISSGLRRIDGISGARMHQFGRRNAACAYRHTTSCGRRVFWHQRRPKSRNNSAQTGKLKTPPTTSRRH